MIQGNVAYRLFYALVTIFAFGAMLSFSGCSGMRHLEEDSRLYTGAELHIEEETPVEDERTVERELNRVLRPQPNNKFLMSRPRMWLYLVTDGSETGWRNWLNRRLGEAPVYEEQLSVEQHERLLANRLNNMGYFDAGIEYQLQGDEKTVSVDYHITLKPPYTFGELHPVDGNEQVEGAINEQLAHTLIQTGEPYSLDLLKQERQRIEQALNNQGYYYFHADHLLFQADSVAGDRRVDIYATLKEEAPPFARRPFRIGDVFIHADYLAANVPPDASKDTISIGDGVYFTDAASQFNPGIFMRSLFLSRDSLYNADHHQRTRNHLMSLGSFRFVNIRFSRRQDTEDDLLDMRVLLSPMEKRSITAEISGVTKSNNFAGPGFSATLTNHNLFGGAEALTLRFDGAYELLVGSQHSASAREFGLETSLSFPRFLLPGDHDIGRRVFSPKTDLSLGVRHMNRTDAFSLTTMQAGYAYGWNSSRTTQYRVSPLVFRLFRLGDVEEGMEGLLMDGALLREGLFEQFIIGSEYDLTYNSRLDPDTRNDWFVQLGVDFSGNLAYLLMNYVLNTSPLEEGGFGIFNQHFAQYTKADADIRYYLDFGNGRRLVTRLFTGAGIPYSNSDMMPYVKQYIIGGANSVRAFHPRDLGPGSYSPDADDGAGYNIYRTGELKLEANLEYRFAITNIFKGALFLDAGNIWRLEADGNVPGGTFSADRFAEEIALGAGTGLRIDAGFFILRFDFAIPLADPATNDGSYFDSVRLLDSDWRRDHLVFNLGIGYPF
ncbi:MAG: BamA/TamA family outer membrane protein [Bacteroidales bacterium]